MVKLPESFGASFESDDDDEKKKRSAPGIGAFARSTLEESKRIQHEEEDDDEDDKEKTQRKNEKAEKTAHKTKSEEAGTETDKRKPEKAPSEEKPIDSETEPAATSSEETETEDQKREILREQLQAETTELQLTLHTAEPGSAAQAEAAALLGATEKLQQKLENPDIETDPAIDVEFDRRMAEMQVSPAEDAVAEVDPDDTPISPILPPLPAVRITMPTTPASTSGGMPPRGPAPPTQSSAAPPPPPTQMPPISGSGAGGGGFNVQPPLTTQPRFEALTPTPIREVVKVKDPSDLLLGGVIGYMVGRRGGRKRTERKLQPEITRLNNEVASTKRHLASREEELRKVAGSQAREQIKPQAPTKRETVPIEQKRSPVSEILRQTVNAPEQLAAVTVAKNETTPLPKPEVQIKKVESLSTPEILKAAETMYIEGASVRRLYETNQIDRTGLIKIVQEGLQGKDIKKVYQDVELGRERQRERAREFRHDDPSFTAITTSDTTQLPTSQPASSLLTPNNPDPTSLRPIINQLSAPPVSVTPPNPPVDSTTPEPKQSYLAAGAVFAIGFGLLLVWVLFSL